MGSGTIRFGTRGSALALAQTDGVLRRLATVAPAVRAEPVVIRTEGDADKISPLSVIGGRGVFTSALQEALRRGGIDAAVHSAKDLPSEEPLDLALVAFPEREDARDVLVSRHGCPLAALPPRPTVGTSSRRRGVQVRALRPDARVVELRGNVDTRLRKALETEVDAIVLAAAGVRRMGWQDRVTQVLPLAAFVPSPGQGALAIEARRDDAVVAPLLAALDDPAVSGAVRLERAFLRAVGGGCTSPIGAHAVPVAGGWRLRAMLGSEDGERVEWAEETFGATDAEAAVAELARDLLARLRAGAGRAVDPRPPVAAIPPVDPAPRRSGSLVGARVLVTRATAQAAPLADALQAEGAEPVLLPTIRIAEPADPAPVDAALRQFPDGYDWVVFTSANAVERLLARLDGLGIDRGAIDGVRVAAVGAATAAALAAAGVRVDLVPARSVAEGVVAALAEVGVGGARVLYPRGDLARDALPAGLEALGARVDAVEAYRTLPETAVAPATRERDRRGEVDAATFASASSVRNLAALLGGDLSPLARATIVCVGPVTADAAREAGLRVDVVAADASVAGMVAALARYREAMTGANGAARRDRRAAVAAAAAAGAGDGVGQGLELELVQGQGAAARGRGGR